MANEIAAIVIAFKRLRAIVGCWDLLCFDINGRISRLSSPPV